MSLLDELRGEEQKLRGLRAKPGEQNGHNFRRSRAAKAARRILADVNRDEEN